MTREELVQHDFKNLGISDGLLKRVNALGFVHPTPIQYKAIPIANQGEDVVGIAQTGSGKTLAFSLPMLQHVSDTNKMGLVLLPTRELAVQVEDTIQRIAGSAGLKTALVIGGTKPGAQIRKLKAKPHVIIATPGRLIDHISQKHISLKNVGMLVLDEADRMLDMGFEPQLKQILADIPNERQTMLFSATMPERITKIAKQYMQKPLRIEVARPGTTVDTIDQEVFIVPKPGKLDLLKKLLKEHSGKVLVFSRTKYGAKKIARDLRKAGIKADEIHSNRSQNQRQKALTDFAKGRCRILVATDIASRGIDVEDIELVVNFDLPDQIEDYVHRIGRTARAGKSGKAISFAAPEQKRDVAQIQELIKLTLPIKSPSGEKLQTIKRGRTGSNAKKTANKRGSGRGRKRTSHSSRGRGGRPGGRRRPPTKSRRRRS